MYKIKIIDGPNINMLGIREINIYGKETYLKIQEYIKESLKKEEVELSFFQSNHEGSIIDEIQKCYFEKYDGLVINPAAYTHTSIAILDALKTINIPTIEVHLSDINSREDFRKKSYISEYCIKRIINKGKEGYVEAVYALINFLKSK